MDADVLRILIVDADQSFGLVLTRVLNEELSASVEAVDQAHDTATAVQLVQAHEYSAVLLDHETAPGGGVEVLGLLRAAGADCPVIFLARDRGEEVAVAAIRAGAADFLLKSKVTASSVARAIKNAIALHRRERLQRDAEERVRASELRFKQLFDEAPIGMAVVRSDLLLRQWNASLRRMLGYGRGRVPVTSLADVAHPGDVATVTREAMSVFRGEATSCRLEARLLHRDGTPYWFDITLMVFRGDAGPYGLMMAQSIHDHKVAEEALRLAEAQYRSLVEAPLVGVFIAQAGRFRYVNPTAAEIFGYSPIEILALESGLTVVADVDRAWMGEHLFSTRDAPHASETRTFAARRKDGRSIQVEVHVTETQFQGARAMMGMFRDVTETRVLEEQLRRSQKMEALGRLAGGIAHDFNNLLTAIFGYAAFVLGELTDERLRQDVQQIRNAGKRAAALTQQLLAFSRKQLLQPEVLDLNVVITELGSMVRRLIGEDIEVVTRLQPSLGAVKADPGQIEQVIINLIINARDAMPKGGVCTVETSNVWLDETQVKDMGNLRPGPCVVISVTDNGVGMDDATRAQLFEPFFTTKALTGGTGLGLSTVYGIVQQSGGHITVVSEIGRGSRFRVYLPRTDQTPRRISSRSGSIAMVGTETVLLVEDEESVRTLATRVLRARGYAVLAASSAEEALRRAEQYQRTIHVLVTDVVMPGASGRTLAEAMTARSPSMKVLFMSGYTDDAIVHHGIDELGTPMLQKPFTPEQLAKKVRDVLDEDPR